MSLHNHTVAFDRCSTMGYQYYEGDQYYDALPVSTSYSSDSNSLYQPSPSYYIPDSMVLAAPLDSQGEQQLIQTPVTEYPQSDPFVTASIYYASQGSSCMAPVDVHDAVACSSVQPYYPERRPSYLSSWAQDVKNSVTRVVPAPSPEYRATIARISDDFLANASSLFGTSDSRSRGASASLNGHAIPRSSSLRTCEPTARKRPSDAMKEEPQTLGARASTAPTEDLRYLPQPHMIVPSQNNVVQDHRGSLHPVKSQESLRSPPHTTRDSLLLGDEVRSSAHQPNKRHRSEEIARHSHATSSHTTWSAPGETVIKVTAARKTGEQKKQALACLFCRERKIACGRPSAHSPDQTCNQCARRRMKCEYPTESRRGQHKRIRRKPIEESSGTSTPSTTTLHSAPNTPLVSASTT